MKHISAGVNADIHTKLIKIGILCLENAQMDICFVKSVLKRWSQCEASFKYER